MTQTTSTIWRVGTAFSGGGLGQIADADTVITFVAASVVDGDHIAQTDIGIEIGVGVNEKPKGNINEIQDTFVDSVTFTVTGFIEDAAGNTSPQIVKEWLMEEKTNSVFTKGRFGIELNDFPTYNVKPVIEGLIPQQPRGLILTSWNWIRVGETQSKAAFVATLRLNGDPGDAGTSPPFSWEVIHA